MADTWLLADVGGSNTRVGLAEAGALSSDSIRSFANVDFAGLSDVLTAYLSSGDAKVPDAICAGVAGPVRDGTAQLTNCDWFIDASALSRTTGAAHVALLNDLQAQGYALDDLPPSHITPLFPGAPAPPDATRVVFGLGTGSNSAVVYATPQGLMVPAAESGHTTLPSGSAQQAELIEYLAHLHPHRPLEAAVSGPGLSNIYAWLTGDQMTPQDILTLWHTQDAAAQNAVALFAQIFGQALGDLCLTHLPKAGVYLIGGFARAIAPCLSATGFHAAFCDKGPYAAIMQDIPISLITDDSAALLGATRYLRQTL